MKNICKMAILMGALALPSIGRADFYIGAGVGSAFNNASLDTDLNFSDYEKSPAYLLSAGFSMPLVITDLRIEAEYLRTRPETKLGHKSTLDAAFANAYLNVPLIPLIDIYAGAGIGAARFEHNTSPALQGMLGAEYTPPIIPLTIGAEYRYTKINESAGKSDNTAKFAANMILFKMRYAF